MQHKLLAAALLAATSLVHAAGFSLSSPEIKSGGTIPKRFEFNGFGCSGENKSPGSSGRVRPRAHKVLPSRLTIRMRRPARAGGTGR